MPFFLVKNGVKTRSSVNTLRICLNGRAPYAGSGHFVTRIGLRVVLPMVAIKIRADHREHDAKPNTSHEVTAARAGLPSGSI